MGIKKTFFLWGFCTAAAFCIGMMVARDFFKAVDADAVDTAAAAGTLESYGVKMLYSEHCWGDNMAVTIMEIEDVRYAAIHGGDGGLVLVPLVGAGGADSAIQRKGE